MSTPFAGTGARWEGHEGRHPLLRGAADRVSRHPLRSHDTSYRPPGRLPRRRSSRPRTRAVARLRADRQAPRVAQRRSSSPGIRLHASSRARSSTPTSALSGPDACAWALLGASARTPAATPVHSRPVDLDVVFLGTSGSAPTAQRAASATLVRRGGDRLLVDCGEGTQRQLLRSDIGLDRPRGRAPDPFPRRPLSRPARMLKTFALRGRELPLTLYGPGLRDLLGSAAARLRKAAVPLETVELRRNVIARDDYAIRRSLSTTAASARLPDHGSAAARSLRCRRRRTHWACRPGASAAPCSAARPSTSTRREICRSRSRAGSTWTLTRPHR